MNSVPPLVFRHKTTLMQRIQDSVRHDYFFHTSGSVPYNKADKLFNKFSKLYGINFSKKQRVLRNKKGIAIAKLFMYPEKGTKNILWWLVATEGEGLIHEEEKLLDARNKRERIRWLDEYELLPMSFEGKKMTWTWRMTSDKYDWWHKSIRLTVRRSNSETGLQKLVRSLFRAPGFSGVRNQLSSLSFQIKKEWERSKGNSDTMPHVPKNTGFVRRKPDNFIALDIVCERLSKNRNPFPSEIKEKVVAGSKLEN